MLGSDMDAEQMSGLVAATTSRIKRAWLDLVNQLRSENTEEALAAKVSLAHRTGRLDIQTEPAAQRFAIGLHAAYINAGQQTAKAVSAQVSKARIRKGSVLFDVQALPAVQWAQANQQELIQQIPDEVRAMIHEVMLEGAKTGSNPLELARDIRGSLGLTAYQAQIVDNYRRELEDGLYAAALRRELSSGHSDRAVAAAMRQQRRLTQAQVETAVQRYRDNFIAKRAEDIARTEGLRVAHQGSYELYRQAAERGDIDPDSVERTWNHFHRPGERSFHEVMDGQTRGLEEPFESGLGGHLLYPGDPSAAPKETINCTCAVSVRVRPVCSANASPDTAAGTDYAELSVEPDQADDQPVAESAQPPASRSNGNPGIGRLLDRLMSARSAHAETAAALEDATAAHEASVADLAAAQDAMDGATLGAAAGYDPADDPYHLAESAAALDRANSWMQPD